MNILLVEADRILGEAVQTALQAFGYKVIRKQSAQTALDTLDDAVPEMIILELQLGMHNGIELLYEIASYPEWQHIPVIVHTINVKAQDENFGKSFEALGVQAVLYKPRTTIAQLVSAVKQFAPVA